MNYLDAIVYGIIQGFAEFLPVSSSGHLVLLPSLLSIKDPGIAFDLMMHLGTSLAVLLYFRESFIALTKDSLGVLLRKKGLTPFLKNYLIAMLGTFILVLPLKGFALDNGRSIHLVAINLIVFGILMWLCDRLQSSDRYSFIKKDSLLPAFILGLAQAVAIFPGVSRSGITLTAARLFRIERADAAQFTFMLSCPIILAGGVEMLPEILKSSEAIHYDVMGLGFLVSFIVALLTIHLFLKFIAKVSLGFFTIYRIILAILILVLLPIT